MSDYTVVYFTALNRGFSVPSTLFEFSLFSTSFEIRFYGLLIAIGFLLGVLTAIHLAKKSKINVDFLFDAIIVGTIFAIIGARLYYVIFNLDYYSIHPSHIFKINEGGLAIYGAIIFAALSVFILCKIKKQNFTSILDLGAIGFLIGQGIGRWGNYTNQEAFGINTTLPWGMTSEKIVRYLTENHAYLIARGIVIDPEKPVHPTFLYESLWCILGAVILYLVYKKFRKFDGQIFLCYGIWYSLERFVVEGLRIDSLYLGFGNIRVSQLLSAVVFVIFTVLLVVLLVKNKDKPCIKLVSKSEEIKNGKGN